jgi:integrase
MVVKAQRTSTDPMSHIQLLNAETDPRHERRVLTDDEFSRLLDATRAGEPFRRISGLDRAILYQLAAFTGLRASELASLTPSSFDLSGDVPSVTVKAANAKGRRTDTLPLHPDVADSMREWRADNDEPDVISIAQRQGVSQQPLWPRRWAANNYGGKMIKHDLKAAGIPYADDEGRVFDFHALRSQFITGLGRSGVPLQIVQKLARHRDPKLTSNIYTKMGIDELAVAVAKLPGISKTGS